MPSRAQHAFVAAIAAAAVGQFALAQDLNLNGVDDANEFGLPVPGSYGAEFFETFESPGLPSGWSTSGLWNVTSLCSDPAGPCNPGSTQFAYYGDTGTCTFDTGARTTGSLTSPTFTFPAFAREGVLTYCSRYSGEGGTLDVAWVRLNNVSQGTAVIIDNAGVGSANDSWTSRSAVFSESEIVPGELYTIEFFFDSIDVFENDFLGWQIDDVRLVVNAVEDCNGNGVPDEVEISRSDVSTNGAADFESGSIDDLSTVSTGPNAMFASTVGESVNTLTWVVTDSCALSGSVTADPGIFSMYFGDPANCDFDTGSREGAYFTVYTVLDQDTNPRLRFSSRYDGEGGAFGGGFDFDARAFTGTSNTQYDVAGVAVYSAFEVNYVTPAALLSVSSVAQTDIWEEFELDLSGLPSGEYSLFFAFDSRDSTSNDSLGWQVDNIRIVTDDPSRDLDDNGRPDDCDSFVYNATDDELFSTLEGSLNSSSFSPNDTIVVSDGYFAAGEIDSIDSGVLANSLTTTPKFGSFDGSISGDFRINGGSLLLNDDVGIDTIGGRNIIVDGGTLNITTGSRVSINDTLQTVGSARLLVNPGAVLDVLVLDVDEGVFDFWGGFLQNRSSGLPLIGTNILGAQPLTVNVWGAFEGRYDFGLNATTNILDDFQITETLSNNGVINIQNGTLTVLGGITNNGTINGQTFTPIDGGRSTPNSLFSPGDITLAADSSFLANAPTFTLNVGGDVDIQINDNDRFAMGASELRLNAVGSQTFEAMSRDRGAVLDGLDASLDGSFPIGTLRVGPLATTATLVDANDNDPANANPEVIYATNVIVEPGATLNLTDHVVYYENAQVLGTVINPGNLIEIEPMLPCPTDLTGDGTTDISDLLQLLAVFNTASASGDITGDGQSDISDLLQLLTQFNTACP